MGKKKKFIDKKKAATFQLISRDSSDPNYSEDPSGDRVFIRVDGNSSDKPFFDDDDNGIFDDADEDNETVTEGRLPSGSSLPDDVRREILELGFPDDGYNYLSHLREIRPSGSFYQNPKARPDQLPRDVKAYDASRIEISKANDEESYKKSIYGVAMKTVPVRIQKAIDPEVAALLDDSDDSRFGSDVEDLEEDFVVNANLPDESEDVELDNKVTSVGGSIVNIKEDECGSYYPRATNVTSSETMAGARPRERRPLDEQFDMLEIQEYGTDSEDEYDHAASEDYEYHESLAEKVSQVPLELDGEYKLLSSDKKIEEPVTLETVVDLRPRCIQYAEQYENEDENDKEDVFLEESSDESEKWDCETIITTYSNLDNHPAKISAPGGRRKKKLTETVDKAFSAPAHVIALKGKEKLPVDFLPRRTTAAEVEKDKIKPKNVQQPKKIIGQESKEEKKERKAAVKEEKREARRAKKDMKGLYKSESQQAQKVAAFTGPSSIHLM
uniref:protein LTV1 homolog n=1 Tax=Erigeron canadensis TaxID=72917 RepID=UPI001CB8CF9F|nr:protein LTV1 homolog [Erigeron canadensis]